MGNPDQQRLRLFRGKSRTGRRVSVRYRARGDQAWIAAWTRNIGVGGAFIEDADLAVGTVLELELQLEGRAAPLPMVGEVRWCGPGRDGSAGGIGLRFIDAEVEALLELDRHLDDLAVYDGGGDEPLAT